MSGADSGINLTLLVKSAINSLYHISSIRNMKSQYNYRKKMLELDRLQKPLGYLNDLRNIRCVGEE
jgi:hypothetical protein